MLENSVPSNTFEVKNLATTEGFVYVGKSSLVDVPQKQKTLKEGDNCFATFMFGTLVPGRNIRIDKPTDIDPNVFVDAKFFDFEPYTPQLSASNLLSYTQASSGDMSYFFKSIINDGSTSAAGWIVLEASDESFYTGYDGVIYYKQTDGTYTTTPVATSPDAISIKTHTFDIKNTSAFNPGLYTHKTTDKYGNTTFYINKLIAGKCVQVRDTGNTLQLRFDEECARPIPCCDDPNYSGADIYDPLSISSSENVADYCSAEAITYISGYDLRKRQDLATIGCDGEFCSWVADTYSFTVTSGPYDPNISGSPIVPYFIRSGWYYRVKAEETTNGYFMWNYRIMKYTTYYRDCSDDESSDYYRTFERDWDRQESKVYRQDVELLVLTKATSGYFDLFTRQDKIQPQGRYLYNEELTNEWIDETKLPTYESEESDMLELNVSELYLDGPHHTENTNTFADVKATSMCLPRASSSSSSMSDSDSMGPLLTSSSLSSSSSSSDSSNSSSSPSQSSNSSSSSSSSSSQSSKSWSSWSGSQSSNSTQSFSSFSGIILLPDDSSSSS
jgi:hypothetical protein